MTMRPSELRLSNKDRKALAQCRSKWRQARAVNRAHLLAALGG
jgi:hypothetical protein